MANAKQLTVCPRCEGETQASDKTCPHCGFRLVVPENPTFDIPAYLHFQKLDVENGIEMETKATDGSRINPKLTKMVHDLRRFWEECDDQTRIAALEDALGCVRHLLNSRASIDCLRKVNGMAKQIGKLGESVEEYLKHGGSYNGIRLPETTTPGLDSEDQEHSRGARVTPLL